MSLMALPFIVQPAAAQDRNWGEDWNGNGRDEHIFRDSNGDGDAEQAWEDANENGNYEREWLDNDNDGDYDELREDLDDDGDYDRVRRDSDNDGIFDQEWVDRNGNGVVEPGEWRPIRNAADRERVPAGPQPRNPPKKAPSITVQPQSQTVSAGSTVTFSVAADGTVPLHYQWYYNNAPLHQASSETLILVDVQPIQTGFYYAQVSNPYGTSRTDTVTLHVINGPTNPASYSASVQTGFSTIANPFHRGSNTLNEVMPSVADGTQIFKFNRATRSYDLDQFIDGWGWEPNLTLAPGEGAWIFSPASQVISFVGEVRESPPIPRPPAAWYLLSSRIPSAVTFEEALGFPPQIGDRILFYNSVFDELPVPPAGASSEHSFGPSGWDTAPSFPIGKSFYVETSSVTNNTSTNTAPQIAHIRDQVIHAGALVRFEILASDMESNKLTYALGLDAPVDARIDAETGAFTWQTTESDQGTVNTIEVRVSDQGRPPLTSTAQFQVAIDAPLRILSATRREAQVAIDWYAIPGKEYVIKSRSDLNNGPWYNEAVVTAGSRVGHYDLTVSPGPERLFYAVSCMQDACCACERSRVDALTWFEKVTFDRVELPNFRGLGIKVEVPLAVKGKLDCLGGSPNCKGYVRIELVGATWQFITSGPRGNPVRDPINQGAGSWGPKEFPVHSESCKQGSPYSASVSYNATIAAQDADLRAEEIRSVAAGTMVLRGTLRFRVCCKCGLENWADSRCRTVTVVVDGRADDADAHRQGGFDLGDSDFDGDGIDGDGVNEGVNSDPNAADPTPYGD